MEQRSGEPAVETPHEASYAASDAAENGEPPADPERDALLVRIQRLEAELQRYREHAQRTSRLFLAASNFADWVRESARRDAEATLRKARARAQRFGVLEEECERAEQELAHLQDELRRMRALADEARSRLSAFLNAGLQALNADAEADAGQTDRPRTEHHEELAGTLHDRLGSTSTPQPTWAAGFERPDL